MALLLCVQLVVSLWASSFKSPTFDEPVHLYSGWRTLRFHDMRVNPEHPPLWKCWAAFPSAGMDLGPEQSDSLAISTIERSRDGRWGIFEQWTQTHQDLIARPDGLGLMVIGRARYMMAIVAGALTLACATLARRLGGDLAGVIAAAAVALDPNALGHGPLVTNDIVASALFIGLALVLARLYERVTVRALLALCAVVGVAMCVKFSALLMFPMCVACLGTRAMIRRPWPTLLGAAKGRARRCGVAIVIVGCAGLTTWLAIWAAYGFQEAASTDGARFDTAYIQRQMQVRETQARIGSVDFTPADLDAWRPSLIGRFILLSDRMHLLPNPWNFGMAYLVGNAQWRTGYAFGEAYQQGRWWYYPVAMFFKTPAPTLVALALGTAIALVRRKRAELTPAHRALLVCTGVVAGIYALASMRSDLNIGLRHFFPTYFSLIALTGAPLAWAVRTSIAGRVVVAGLGVWLAIAIATAFPNYIAYFNLPSMAFGRPINLIGDSNLDWGQDLPSLATWQRAHPKEKLYLSYFGTWDPKAYGIDFTPALLKNDFGGDPQPINEAGVIAVSASYLQAITQPGLSQRMRSLRLSTPREELGGGSILLFVVAPKVKP